VVAVSYIICGLCGLNAGLSHTWISAIAQAVDPAGLGKGCCTSLVPIAHGNSSVLSARTLVRHRS
jgi:hypothetical protein